MATIKRIVIKNGYMNRTLFARSNFSYNPKNKTWYKNIDEIYLESSIDTLIRTYKIKEENIEVQEVQL